MKADAIISDLGKLASLLYPIGVLINVGKGRSNGRNDHTQLGKQRIPRRTSNVELVGQDENITCHQRTIRSRYGILVSQTRRCIQSVTKSTKARKTSIKVLTTSIRYDKIIPLNETKGLGATNATALLNKGKGSFPMSSSHNSKFYVPPQVQAPAQPTTVKPRTQRGWYPDLHPQYMRDNAAIIRQLRAELAGVVAEFRAEQAAK